MPGKAKKQGFYLAGMFHKVLESRTLTRRIYALALVVGTISLNITLSLRNRNMCRVSIEF